jgi:hypothetical protein
VLCEFRGWVGVWYLDINKVGDCVVVKISLIEIYIGTAITYFSFQIFVLVDECSTGVVVYNFKTRHPCCVFSLLIK